MKSRFSETLLDEASPSSSSEEEETVGRCALCSRLETLTRHHLIPRSRHTKARMLKRFSRQEMRTRIAMICRPCHSNLHRHVSEQELSESYSTLEALSSHPDIQKFTRWIERRPSGFLPP